MKKNSRKSEWNLQSKTLNGKRKCTATGAVTIGSTAEKTNIWSNDSLFADSRLGSLIDVPKTPNSQKATTIDDSLFSASCLDESFGALSTPIRLTQCSLEHDDTLLSGVAVNLFSESYSCVEDVDLFADVECEEQQPDKVQNTQRFLDDIIGINKEIETENQSTKQCAPLALTQVPVYGDGMAQGSQYETSESLRNSTLKPEDFGNLSQYLMGESQPFELPVDVDDVEDIPSLGSFYGLPDKVKRLILEHKGIKGLYEWQDECLNLPAIGKRKNLIYALPTSGGKTLVAEILMLRELLCRGKNVLFILPYVSIVQEKVSAMSPFAIVLDFIVDEYTSGKGRCPPVKQMRRKHLFVASIEKGAILMDSLIEAGRASEIGLVVIDELHLVGEKGRGATLEALLAKIMFLNAKIQIVGMSATIGNLPEVSKFLNADVYTRGFRPVELKEYIKCGNDLLEIVHTGKTVEETFVYRRTVNFKYSATVARYDPDHLAGLVAECAPENCCLVFCSTRKNCESVALLLTRILPKTKFLEHRKSEKADLMDGLDKVCGILSPVLSKTIPFGIAYHHSGLTTDERRFIEAAYRFGVLSVICCTSTLAAGVNLPAKRVIIRAPYVGAEFMTLCKYKQMVGRAGRAGMGLAGESILITTSRDNVRVGEMLFSPMDKAISSLGEHDYMGLQGLILSAIGLQIANCRQELMCLISSTLLSVQSEHLAIDLSEVLLKILREMFSNKVLQLCSDQVEAQCTQTQNATMSGEAQGKRRISIGRTTRFQLSTIGRAAFKAGIDYKRTFAIHSELLHAQQSLILTNYSHLLYLVVCFNSNTTGDELFAADAVILFRLYSTANEITMQLCRLLGISEAHAAKLAKTHSLHGPMELKWNRLYKVLILVDVLDLVPVPLIAAKFNIERGMLQNLISQSTAAASALVRLCEQVNEFWCYKPLFERISAKMDRCGTLELEPLLELPAVKINRAKQLYAAGYKTLEDIAKCRPGELVRSVEHMPMRIAKEITSAAMIILMKKLDHLEGETAALKDCLQHSDITS